MPKLSMFVKPALYAVFSLTGVLALTLISSAHAQDQASISSPSIESNDSRPINANKTLKVAEKIGLGLSNTLIKALSLIGIAYKYGGNQPDTGLDCSGFVRYVFKEGAGVELPRRADEMSKLGKAVEAEQLKPGDLVFYNTLRRTFSHVGIYLGENRFIHAPSRGGGVRIEDMTGRYWTSRFNGARRLAAEEPSNPAIPSN